MKNIYCISGLGADEKVFNNLEITGYNICYLNWLIPKGNEGLASYAERMRAEIPEASPVILGLSFGGMLAIEMAKQRTVSKIILVSAPKTVYEIPLWMRVGGKLRLHKIIPLRVNKLTEKADDRRMGIVTKEEKAIVTGYRENADHAFIGWAVDRILKWKNREVPGGIFQIHGDADRMFPSVKNPAYTIPGGTHIMILNRAKEISHCIAEILSEGGS